MGEGAEKGIGVIEVDDTETNGAEIADVGTDTVEITGVKAVGITVGVTGKETELVDITEGITGVGKKELAERKGRVTDIMNHDSGFIIGIA